MAGWLGATNIGASGLAQQNKINVMDNHRLYIFFVRLPGIHFSSNEMDFDQPANFRLAGKQLYWFFRYDFDAGYRRDRDES